MRLTRTLKSTPHVTVDKITNTLGWSRELTAACNEILECKDIQPDVFGYRVGIFGDEFLEHYAPAVELIAKYINTGSTICVAYDYDCDGITAGACLTQTLAHLGAKVVSCVPDKMKDGYGLCVRAVQAVAPEPCLVVTVDNGITSREPAKALTELGYTVLITDHHLQEGDLPQAEYILNPKLYATEADDEYMGSGCYVAAKLSMQLVRKYHHGSMFTPDSVVYKLWQYLCCLTGISIISDIIPINPTMSMQVQLALAELSVIEHAGLRALKEMCGVKATQPITATTLGFYIAPRINSAGKIGDPTKAFDLLCTWDTSDGSMGAVQAKAAELRNLNSTRKTLEQTVFDEACIQAEQLIKSTPHALVLHHPAWHAGVCGVVASRIVEKYGVPCLVLTTVEGGVTGSGRAPASCNLLSVVSACGKYLTKFGGHKVACGVTMDAANLEAFKQEFNTQAQILTVGELTKQYDCTTSIPVLQDIRFKEFLHNFQPSGNTNPEVVIRVDGLKIVEVERLNNKLNLIMIDGSGYAICLTKFRPPLDWGHLQRNQVIDVLCTISATYFRGNTYYEYNLVDIDPPF